MFRIKTRTSRPRFQTCVHHVVWHRCKHNLNQVNSLSVTVLTSSPASCSPLASFLVPFPAVMKSLDEGGKYAQLALEIIGAICSKDVEKLKSSMGKDRGCFIDSNLWLRGPVRLTGGEESETEYEEGMIFGYFANSDEGFNLKFDLVSTKLISEYDSDELNPPSEDDDSESGAPMYSMVNGVTRLLISHPSMEEIKQEVDFQFFAMFYEGLLFKLSIFVNPTEYALLGQKFSS